MSNLWKILNAPIVVVLIALAVWPALGAYTGFKVIETGTVKVKNAIKDGFSQAAGDQDKKLEAKIKLLANIDVKNIKSVRSGWKGKEKIVAEIVNNTDKTIKSIHISVSFYNKEGGLIDVNNQWLGGKFVLPKDKYAFDIKRDIGERDEPEEVLNKRKSHKVEIKVVDFDVLE